MNPAPQLPGGAGRRKEHSDRTRALPRARIERMLSRRDMGVGNNGARKHVRPSSLLNTASRGRDHVYGPCWRCRNGLYAS